MDFQIQCKAQDVFSDREVDLTPLKNVAHNYLARINYTLKSSQPNGVLVCSYDDLIKTNNLRINSFSIDFQILMALKFRFLRFTATAIAIVYY